MTETAGDADRRFMRLALALGERNLGRTWPNPSVGAVVVAGPPGAERIVGQGVTAPGGRPHGEPLAVAMAGEAARGATLYVTLEPCSHHGRTPPCTDSILSAGIARVVTAMEDPDPRVAGSGHARLAAAGVALTMGVLREEAMRAHLGHVSRITLGRPCVHLKLAATSDGFAAGGPDGRLRITGPVANGAVHLWRAHADAIMVGIGTVRADDPSLTVRLPGLSGRSPVRVVLDSTLRILPSTHLVRSARDIPTLVLTTRGAPAHARRMLAATGVEILSVDADATGRIDLPAALACLSDYGLSRICSEGGPHLADALAEADLVDVCTLVTGEGRLGEGGGLKAIGPHLEGRLSSGQLRQVEARDLGADRAVTYERSVPCSPVS
ncbi:bifunctional diaminohydroxyphosphoribosylaminopyrimidine deaminase/5-amino-6-(5-phosphoribosylamino)uracil reductase [Methylobacterium sp. Leaf399]|uniref:bifunctional diaminohydroxyphosphoribosylaminopyrimidine deaminase/5-amino-6-(5-phosphoribosylamino)uracil reductase RibD n=1 Tax=unclassified Methylobacterium TaxID=2615210 RepID=UPI0006F9FCDA|nr:MULTISPECIES: bifunctional diaminohydroxyphosphoribosylaminopyrimidine deaminase/5-amino-6-(5-phosphoribosylamino)uracil reductase RibD [unclassified Methylobacterium]KQP51673.1 bifunctional diaminohydroxyphosphoribosylaminopyrimidine deaminase/5-amino-6-(5-phosphoribosylamino)uracil reductase [Methylobacterium sp. Leaf108]KQT14908.1 bifunctional diaminohydroxyphosphoribosylaminopyrimidine deaminase/5-amino-6-(5-phosphoribosylamino)uracil reductase [Methylobacterium sp. Leaf399]